MKNRLCFQCVDEDELVQVEEEVAMQMGMVKGMMEDLGGSIVLLNISGRMLRKIVEYCEMSCRRDDGFVEADQFLAGVDKETLFEMAGAACYMGVEGLVGLVSRVLEEKIGGMSADQAQQYLGVSD